MVDSETAGGGRMVDSETAGSRRARAVIVSPGYFDVLGLPLRQGRVLAPTDRVGNEPVVLVNEAFVRRHFTGEDALGHRLRLESAGAVIEQPTSRTAVGGDGQARTSDPTVTIVGIVGDERRSHPVIEPQPVLYLPHAQNPAASMTIVLRVDPAATGISEAVRSRMAEVAPDQPLYDLLTLEENIDRLLALPRAIFGMLAVFATIGLLLAVVGAYGMVSHAVHRRVHELGVRMALGAAPSLLFLAVVRDAALMVGTGVAFGLAVATAITSLVSSVFYGVSAFDPVVFLGVPTLLALGAILAALQPARMASRVDPAIMLRVE
jgi:hypothetical protein